MRRLLLVLWAFLSAGAGASTDVPAASRERAPESIVGEVAKAPASTDRQMVVRKDAGDEITVTFSDTTAFLRARPGATTLEGATRIAAADVVAGDRVLCRGDRAADGQTLAANRIVVMTRADLEARRTREREDWRRRGLSGVITAADPASHEVTVRMAGGSQTVIVAAGAPGIAFRRYPPSSVRFDDARPSSFAELAAGDQVRVLGDRSPDGTHVSAEQIVSGAFRVLRGVVADLDAGRGVLTVRDNARGGGLVALSLAPNALVRRLPPMLVMRLLRTAQGEAGGARPGAPAAAPAVPAAMGRVPDPDELLERLPPIGFGDMRKGEEVAALGPRQSDATGLTAIKLAVWAVEAWPEARGSRGRREGGEGQADPFAEVLGGFGETPW